MNVEVILREDVEHLGKAGTLVKVKPGYARNFLLPRGLAYQATDGNKRRIEAEQRARATKLTAERGDAETVAARIATVALTVKAKAGEGDRLFGSITAQDLASRLAELGIAIDKRRFELDHPIKSLGVHTVSIRLHPEVRAAFTLTVEPE
jgi:large subunit ribosomal protein L9